MNPWRECTKCKRHLLVDASFMMDVDSGITKLDNFVCPIDGGATKDSAGSVFSYRPDEEYLRRERLFKERNK